MECLTHSSVTALAFAAASVAEEEAVVEPSIADSQSVEKIVEKVDSLIRSFGKLDSVSPSLVDDVVIERAAHLIDIRATVTFRDLRLRLQCPLTLDGAHRACDLRLQFKILEITNAEGTDIKSAQSSSLSTTTTVTSPHHGHHPTFLQPPANRGDEGSTESPPFARKLFRFEGVTLHWDLWDTRSGQNFSPSSTKSASISSPSTSSHDISLKDEFFSGPEPESMVASACLLSLLGPDNYLTIHILQDSSILSRIISRPSQTSRPALVDLNVDLGPLVVCLCPSQIFWLGVMITQLTKLFEAYNTVQKAEEQVEDDYDLNNSDNGDLRAGALIDLEISSEDACVTSESVDGNMFRSCLGASSFPLLDGAPSFIESPPLAVCARCRLFTLTLFYTDEEASFSNSTALHSVSIDSSGPEESFHEAFSSPLESEPAQGALKIQNDFFVAVAGGDESVCDVLAGKRSVPAAEWMENVNSKLAQLTQGRNRLLLSMGHCGLEISPESNQRINKDKDAGSGKIFSPRGLLTGRVEGFLLSECLFSQNESTSPKIVNVSPILYPF
eukprot:TsM_000502000 transcript=TsM_000502000 gene=TsM_000502000